MKWFPSAGSLLDWLEGPQAGSHFRTESGVESVDRWIVQPWRSGTPASLSLIADGESPPRLVGCMGQTIERRESVQYSGGFGPIEEDRFESLQSWARAVLAPYEGVRGWIGLDMIIPPHRENVAFGTASHRSGHFPKEFLDSAPWSLIEINPRLTTSYVGVERDLRSILGGRCFRNFYRVA